MGRGDNKKTLKTRQKTEQRKKKEREKRKSEAAKKKKQQPLLSDLREGRMNKLILLLISFMALSFSANAQNIRPAGLNAYAGFGFAEFSIDEDGSQNLRMDRGLSASIAGERGFEVLNSYLTFTINLLKSEGNSNYSYTPLGGTTVTATNVSFSSDLFQFALGYKIKFIDDYWFRPYVEAGVVGGYYNLKYSLSSVDSGNLSDAKTKESLTQALERERVESI